jgi:hypothetical protein
VNQLINTQTTMSSREIAELTGKNHADVMRDIRTMLEQLEVGASSFAGSYMSEQNKSLPLFNLPKRECLILVSGYSVRLRAKIIDRWQELEPRATQHTPLACPPEVAAMQFAALLNQHLRLEGSAALGTVRQALALKAPEYLPLLPGYAVDAPPSELTTRGSSRPTVSMLQLLKDEKARRNFPAKVSTKLVAEVNEVLVEMGLLESRTRPSASSITGVAHFKSVTDRAWSTARTSRTRRTSAKLPRIGTRTRPPSCWTSRWPTPARRRAARDRQPGHTHRRGGAGRGHRPNVLRRAGRGDARAEPQLQRLE